MIETLQKLSEIISITNDDFNKGRMIEIYNEIVSASITPCQVHGEQAGTVCGKRSVKAVCYKANVHSIAWTLLVHVCDSHLEYAANLPEHFAIQANRFVIGDRARCEQTPYSAGLGGDNQKANG